MTNRFTDEEINQMLELPRKQDLEKINELEGQIEVLKKLIKELRDELFSDEEEIMTPSEYEYYINKIRVYSDIFDYGNMRKMAENL